MLPEQFKITFNALCQSYPEVCHKRIPLALSILDGAPMEIEDMQDRVLNRAEVARMIGRTPRTVDKLCSSGIFKRVYFGSSGAAYGILASSVIAGMNADACKPGRRATK